MAAIAHNISRPAQLEQDGGILVTGGLGDTYFLLDILEAAPQCAKAAAIIAGDPERYARLMRCLAQQEKQAAHR